LVGLFSDFYEFVTGEDLEEEQIAVFTNIVNSIRESERLT